MLLNYNSYLRLKSEEAASRLLWEGDLAVDSTTFLAGSIKISSRSTPLDSASLFSPSPN